MRPGKRLAIDVGRKRIGVAISDVNGILASPLQNVVSAEELVQLLPDDLLEIYVGLPLNLAGTSTASTELAIDFALELSKAVEIPVRLVDERMTTAMANQQLREIGKSQKDARSTIDQMAAVAILEYAMQLERNTGKEPGVSLEDWRDSND